MKYVATAAMSILIGLIFSILAGCGGPNMGAKISTLNTENDCILVTMTYSSYEGYNGIYCRADIEIP